MFTGITHTSILVRDYDEALKWYTEVLGLEARSNETMPGTAYRWVTVGVPGQNVEIVLHLAGGGIGGQTAEAGQSPGVVISTNDCEGDVNALRARGATIAMGPERQMWGTQAVVLDLYGNPLVLVQPPA
jgi:catechol 2,3-dioxygenase-like lactoylglutathione lyase family enzyme